MGKPEPAATGLWCLFAVLLELQENARHSLDEKMGAFPRVRKKNQLLSPNEKAQNFMKNRSQNRMLCKVFLDIGIPVSDAFKGKQPTQGELEGFCKGCPFSKIALFGWLLKGKQQRMVLKPKFPQTMPTSTQGKKEYVRHLGRV